MPLLGPPEALSPRDWNALVDYDEWNDLYTPDEGVVFHHGGGANYPAGNPSFSVADEIQQLQQWEGYHLFSKGWRGLAYGWGVGQSGTIYRIRGWNSYGAHRGDHDGDGISNNEELIPIIWVASGNHHTVSQAAQDAVSRLRRWMLNSAPRATWLYGHREVSSTDCPGPNGMTYVTANRQLEEDMPLTNDDLEKVRQIIWFNADMRDYTSGKDLHAATLVRHARHDAFQARVDAAVARKIMEQGALSSTPLTQSQIEAIATEVADELRARLAE